MKMHGPVHLRLPVLLLRSWIVWEKAMFEPFLRFRSLTHYVKASMVADPMPKRTDALA